MKSLSILPNQHTYQSFTLLSVWCTDGFLLVLAWSLLSMRKSSLRIKFKLFFKANSFSLALSSVFVVGGWTFSADEWGEGSAVGRGRGLPQKSSQWPESRLSGDRERCWCLWTLLVGWKGIRITPEVGEHRGLLKRWPSVVLRWLWQKWQCQQTVKILDVTRNWCWRNRSRIGWLKAVGGLASICVCHGRWGKRRKVVPLTQGSARMCGCRWPQRTEEERCTNFHR